MLQTVTTGGRPNTDPLRCSHALKSGCAVEEEKPFGDGLLLLLLLRFDNRWSQGQEWVRLLYQSIGGWALGRALTYFAFDGMGNELIVLESFGHLLCGRSFMSHVSNISAGERRIWIIIVFKYVSLQNSGGSWNSLMLVLGLGLLYD